MPRDLRDDEQLEPVDLQADSHPKRPARRFPATLLLAGLLTVWAVGVSWFFSRQTDGELPPAEATPVPTEPAAPGETPVPAPAPPTATPEPTPTLTPSIAVTTSPPGATVLRNGGYAGITPFHLEDPGAGDELRFRLEGHEPARLQLRGGEESVELELRPIPGTLRIRVFPPDATVLLNGRPLTLTGNGEIETPMTPQRLRAEAPGYEPVEVTVTPATAYVREVDLRLKPIPTPTPVRPPGEEAPEEPARMETPAGHVMVKPELPLEATLGSPRGSAGRQSNEVERRVRLTRAFRISETEVSNRQFRAFRPEHDSGRWNGVGLNADPLPVVNVTWEDAVEYCNWLSDREGLPRAFVKTADGRWRFEPEPGTGYRLPTESEWEGIVRAETGTTLFPWGQELPPPSGVNVAGSESKTRLAVVLETHRDGHVGPAPVSEAWKGPFPVKGLAGNVGEWMLDGYAIPDETSTPAVDPASSADKRFHVIKGAGWRSAGVGDLRTARRRYDERASVDVGFRVARYIE